MTMTSDAQLTPDARQPMSSEQQLWSDDRIQNEIERDFHALDIDWCDQVGFFAQIVRDEYEERIAELEQQLAAPLTPPQWLAALRHIIGGEWNPENRWWGIADEQDKAALAVLREMLQAAAPQPPQWQPATDGHYRGSDPQMGVMSINGRNVMATVHGMATVVMLLPGFAVCQRVEPREEQQTR